MDVERVIRTNEGDNSLQMAVATFFNDMLKCLESLRLPVFHVAFLAPKCTAGHSWWVRRRELSVIVSQRALWSS